jgi:cyclophilin family peptidyl-prolyl cis-trans isomerase
MPEIIHRLQQGLYSDGMNTTFKYIELQKYFSALYANWFNGPDTFTVFLRNREGETERKIASIDHVIIDKARGSSPALPYRLEFLPGQTARMTISSFWEDAKGMSYKKFLTHSFSALQDSGTQSLILDLRDNEGGMDYRGALLMRYLTNSPFRYYDRLVATTGQKYSFANQARLPGFYNLRRRFLSRTESGSYIWKHSRGLKTQKPMKEAYLAPTYVLINGASFSVTAEFAAVAHHLGRAVFIGEETGGAYNGNNSGSFVIITLPNSRLNVGIPMLAYYTAVGSPWPGHGVMPDYHVVPDTGDILSSNDPVMDFALKLTASRSDEPDTVPIVIRTTAGDMYADLYVKKAPVTSLNFLHYIDLLGKTGGSFYRTVTPVNQPDKKIRIEVIQGGFNLADVDTAALIPIPLERTRLTGIFHTDGTLSMARSDPDSGSTEFFICIGDQPSLDFGGKRNPDGQGFAAFGRITNGMEVVRKIQQSPSKDQALTPEVGILGMERLKAGGNQVNSR